MTSPTTVLPTTPPSPGRPSPMSRPMLVAFVVLSLLVVSGGYLFLTKDDASTTPVATSLTHRQLVSRAEAICTTLNADSAKVRPPAGATPAQTAAFLDQQAALARAALVTLRALAAPAADQRSWTVAMTGIDRMLVDTRAASAALRKGEVAVAQSKLAAAERGNKVVNARFTGLGMPACAS